MIDLEAIKERLSKIPRDLEILEVRQPVMVKDPVTGKPTPTGNTRPQRVDVRSASSGELMFHYHSTATDMFHTPKWKEHAELTLQLYKDLEEAILEIEKLRGEK